MEKRNLFLSLLFVIAIFMITGCVVNKSTNAAMKINEQETINESEFDNNMEIITNIKISINGKTYDANIEDNETAQAFVQLLPQQFHMNELNGNEKYIYMDYSLPTKSYHPKHIVAGDIMLYGNNCLVIFYESFETNYSYTKIGHIHDLSHLGKESIIVTFQNK